MLYILDIWEVCTLFFSLTFFVFLLYYIVPGGDNFGEATLDLQTITGIAPGLKTFVSNTDNSSSTEDGKDYLLFLYYLNPLLSSPTII